MLEAMIDWIDNKIELNNRLLSDRKELSDFDIFLMADVEMLTKIKEELQK